MASRKNYDGQTFEEAQEANAGSAIDRLYNELIAARLTLETAQEAWLEFIRLYGEAPKGRKFKAFLLS